MSENKRYTVINKNSGDWIGVINFCPRKDERIVIRDREYVVVMIYHIENGGKFDEYIVVAPVTMSMVTYYSNLKTGRW